MLILINKHFSRNMSGACASVSRSDLTVDAKQCTILKVFFKNTSGTLKLQAHTGELSG